MTTIHRLAPDDLRSAAAWDDFVRACPSGTFFHQSAFAGLLRSTFRHTPHYLFAENHGRITGVLPLAEVKSLLFGHALTSLPFAVYGGVAAQDEATAQALEAEADALGRRLGVQHLELRQIDRRHEGWPAQDLYVTFRKPIVADEEANLLAIPRKQRAMVRKGIQRGLVSKLDDGIDRFFALYADNVHRHGTPAMPKAWFAALRRTFGDRCRVLTVETAEGQPVSSVLSFYWRDEVLPYYAGDAEAARDLAANDFKYWELMRRSGAEGITLFDYGRSKQGTGSFSFKKNWGFEPQPLSYEYRLYKREAVPQNNPSNAKYRMLIETWRRLPIGFANWLGPFVVRSLG